MIPFIFITLTAIQDKPAEDLQPGLVGEYFYVAAKIVDFPEPRPAEKPRFKRVDAQIDFPKTWEQFGATLLRDYFHVRWTGVLRIPEAGVWIFTTKSDDGSRLFIDGKLRVRNGGLHDTREEAGEVELAAGDHEIRVDYFENTGHAGITVYWQGPGRGKTSIPPSAFRHRASAEPTEEEKREIRVPPEPPLDREEDNEERPRRVEKPPPLEPFPVDPAVVARDEKQPDLGGRIVSVFEDGGVWLLTLKQPSRETPVFVPKSAVAGWVSIDGAARTPTPGYVVYVWLKPGSSDTAAAVRYGLENKP